MRSISRVLFVLLSAAAVCASACAGQPKCRPGQGDSAQAAGAQASGAQAQDAPGCEEALRTAAKNVPEIAGRDVLADAVAACIKDEWSAEMRQCVATARAQTDFAACMTRHQPQQGARSGP